MFLSASEAVACVALESLADGCFSIYLFLNIKYFSYFIEKWKSVIIWRIMISNVYNTDSRWLYT